MISRGQPRADTKLVPMTREFVEEITAALSFAPGGEALLDALFAAYDAAPADPEAAIGPFIRGHDHHVRQALRALGYESGDKPDEWCPRCHRYHARPVGEQTDAGKLVRECAQNPYPEAAS